MNLTEQLKNITNKMTELETESRSTGITVERLAAINDEMDGLIAQRSSLETQIKKSTEEAFKRAGTSVNAGQKDVEQESEKMAEERARTLKQGRAITLSTLDTITIDHKANNIKGTFNQVSNILDLVTFKYLPGGESFTQAFIKTYGEGGYTTEGGNPTNSEPTWGYAQLNKTKITAYTEVSEEFEKLKPSFYLTEIQRNLTISLRKTLAKEIIKGDGDTSHITGILAPAAKVVAIETTKDIEISAIDENTLSDVIIGFGGDEDIHRGVLVINKLDLKDFLRVRGTDKKPVYKVDFVNQTIDGVPYVISSHVKPFSTAAAGNYTFFYGTLGHYDLVAFSPIEVSKSTDYKFKEGQVAYRAVGFFGGNTTAFNAFVRTKKKVVAGG